MKQFLKVKQVAKILQVHHKSIYRFIEQGRLEAIRLAPGNRIRFTEEQVRDFLIKKDCDTTTKT